MHVLINVKSSNNISKWQVGFNSAFKGVKNTVCVLAGYVVPVLQNGALKWKKKLTGVRSRRVTSDHTLKLKLCEEKTQPKFIMLYMKFVWIV
jgi:hypothetical protein